MVCGNFILPEPASYVFFYAFSNLRNLLYIIFLRGHIWNRVIISGIVMMQSSMVTVLIRLA